MNKINWSTENCVCGYWVKGKYSGMKSHNANCPCKIHDNTPNAKGLMLALRTLASNKK